MWLSIWLRYDMLKTHMAQFTCTSFRYDKNPCSTPYHYCMIWYDTSWSTPLSHKIKSMCNSDTVPFYAVVIVELACMKKITSIYLKLCMHHQSFFQSYKLICWQHHMENVKVTRHPKVIFLVEQSALAEQQGKQCMTYLPCKIKVITGESQRNERIKTLNEWIARLGKEVNVGLDIYQWLWPFL